MLNWYKLCHWQMDVSDLPTFENIYFSDKGYEYTD